MKAEKMLKLDAKQRATEMVLELWPFGDPPDAAIQAIIDHLYSAMVDGYNHGLWNYATWKDGTQYVGSCGKTLEEAKIKT
jgi:hypothetical protein